MQANVSQVWQSWGMASAPVDADLYRRDLDPVKKPRRLGRKQLFSSVSSGLVGLFETS